MLVYMKVFLLLAAIGLTLVGEVSAQTVVRSAPAPAVSAPIVVEGIVIKPDAKIVEDRAFVTKITAAL